MYLKSIEVQGFKSFANKIVFQFHNGITGIVGPNGSGKSNVADAVRWVLGEQRVKQLRGGTMQDIIFAGSENRKPLGYAYVAITLDNADHRLPVFYDEVTVARRLYRSGESEYMLNGVQCRLKDVNELFYDTGIGKEGYSIIGQGQIEKILNGKPEEKRELFDEAAGIVKYKRRKATAQKKLEDEQQNLIRVNDILSELTRQIGPLSRQAETARVYLKKREELKAFDVNMFLLDIQRIKESLNETQQKFQTANGDLEQTRQSYEQTRQEYEVLEAELEQIEDRLKEEQENITQTRLRRQQLENQIALLQEQIKTDQLSDEHLQSRIQVLEKEISDKKTNGLQMKQEQELLLKQADVVRAKNQTAQEGYQQFLNQIDQLSEEIEGGKSEIIRLLNSRGSIKGKLQRYDTMIEQIDIRRAQLNQQVIKLKSEESDQNEVLTSLQQEYDKVTAQIEALNQKNEVIDANLGEVQEKLTAQNQQMEQDQTEYDRQASRLESLKNITERYDGYGNSIRRVMEQKSREKGLHGVVAGLIKTEKKYEIAVETALGGSIQNIVTEDEATAKRMIEYLKRNKFGRATFLPLTAMKNKGGFNQQGVLKEAGVIGLASTLVTAEEKYVSLVEYLLGRTVFMDQIDHAIE
ncbi:MAG: chromosome segregation protein SMC, partial [Lachnospiraceae bacterium]|nr:chromosome segregation protein SMC [Lachnospiraceae bacterium]